LSPVVKTTPEMRSINCAVAATAADPHCPISPAPTRMAGGPDVPVPGPGTDGVGEGEDGDELPHPHRLVVKTTIPTTVRRERRFGDTERRLSYAERRPILSQEPASVARGRL
jgi:hypothetical protein